MICCKKHIDTKRKLQISKIQKPTDFEVDEADSLQMIKLFTWLGLLHRLMFGGIAQQQQ